MPVRLNASLEAGRALGASPERGRRTIGAEGQQAALLPGRPAAYVKLFDNWNLIMATARRRAESRKSGFLDREVRTAVRFRQR